MGYCSQCGIPIPTGQRICSMCYGDPFYGRDGYYFSYLNYMYEQAAMEEEERRHYELDEELKSWEAASEKDIED